MRRRSRRRSDTERVHAARRALFADRSFGSPFLFWTAWVTSVRACDDVDHQHDLGCEAAACVRRSRRVRPDQRRFRTGTISQLWNAEPTDGVNAPRSFQRTRLRTSESRSGVSCNAAKRNVRRGSSPTRLLRCPLRTGPQRAADCRHDSVSVRDALWAALGTAALRRR
jgi:hypothetical protein